VIRELRICLQTTTVQIAVKR